MSAPAAGVTLVAAGRERRVSLFDWLDADGAERAAVQANAWIKSLRLARVDGASFRERFTYQDDSLWWFAELYLHKERAILALFRALRAASALFDAESPSAIRLDATDDETRLVVPQLAQARGIQVDGVSAAPSPTGFLDLDARSTSLLIAALASPRRPFRQPRRDRTAIAAFVHSAFWRADGDDGAAESYIGPVLHALERRLPADSIRYVGLGPATNFRARRWWRAGQAAPAAIAPIESLAPRRALAGSIGTWAGRHAMRRALQSSADIRAAATIEGCDCWPIVARALAGVALLQFPWSARAIDEAGAALDVLDPAAALTYAEAGGWGRALAIAARRRRIPLAGLQHGFIYRHWLNYLHEPDEMSAAGADAGFPLPTTTLLFDEYAAQHLRSAGAFPDTAVAVTGSPRLDELAATFSRLTADEVEAARSAAGSGDRAMLLLVTKYSEVRAVLPALLDAMRALPGAHLAIKAHPAETTGPYDAAAAGLANVRVLPPSAPLAPLLKASRAVVTVNSTVALDAMSLGVPGLAIGLPNNLSPFVEAGGLAGARGGDEMRLQLERVLYDEEFRQRLSAAAVAVVAQHRMAPGGGAADRSAAVIVGLMGRPANGG